MSGMGAFTRQDPVKMTQVLEEKFSERLATTPQINEDMQAWNLALGRNLAELRGRILDPEKIIGAGSASATYEVDIAD